MFYFTCNESKIYESFTFLNKLQDKINFFTTLVLFLAACFNFSFSLVFVWSCHFSFY